MAERIAHDTWERLVAMLDHVERGDRWGLEMDWLGLAPEERSALFVAHGVVLGVASATYTGGRPLAEVGVGQLAHRAWRATREWSGVSEATLFALFNRLGRGEGGEELGELSGWLFTLALATLLDATGEPGAVLGSIGEELVSRYLRVIALGITEM